MPRTVSEWKGKTDNHMPPATVRQRILEREHHTCHICQGRIDKPGWHADHVPPLKDGGENRESKIKPAHEQCHRLLTAKQAVERAPIERKKLKASGAIKPKSKLSAQAKEPKQSRHQKMQPRSLYEVTQ